MNRPENERDEFAVEEVEIPKGMWADVPLSPGFQEQLLAQTRAKVRTRRWQVWGLRAAAAVLLYVSGIATASWWNGSVEGGAPSSAEESPVDAPPKDRDDSEPDLLAEAERLWEDERDLSGAVQRYREVLDREEQTGEVAPISANDHWLLAALRDDRRRRE